VVNSVGAVTLPLLAGFSIKSVVVSDDAASFRWPGLTTFVLAIAALALIATVQCACHDQLYLSKKNPNRKRHSIGLGERDGFMILAFSSDSRSGSRCRPAI
jgi:hypothetical protein